MRNLRVTLNCESITTCESEIQEMVDVLLNPRPISARGVATASRLLCDGTGPVYNRSRSATLGTALRGAIDQLDPAIPLYDS